jgi:hypothetical protein
LTIAFSVEQAGQVNRITYPLRVPAISGFTEFFIIGLVFFSRCSLRGEIHPDLVFDPFFWIKRVLQGSDDWMHPEQEKDSCLPKPIDMVIVLVFIA